MARDWRRQALRAGAGAAVPAGGVSAPAVVQAQASLLVTVPGPMMADLRRRTAELLADFMKRAPSSQTPIKAYLAELKRA